MHIVRTVVWVLLLAGLVIFSAFNWNPVTVKIWENLVVETKIPAIVIVSFLIGFAPMWLLHRATKWQLRRRIASLETTVRASAQTAPAATAAPEAQRAEPFPAAEHPAPPAVSARVDEYRPPNAQ